jgi:hypothetical protein
MGLYEYVRGGAIDAVDPWGLCACDDGTIRPERYDDHHDDRQKFEEGRPQDREKGKEHLVPEEFQDDKYKKRWHDHLGKAQKEWTGKTRAKRGEKHLPEGEIARQILEFAEENNIRLREETLDKLKRISSMFAFASSLLLVEQVMAEIRSAEAAVGDPENPCGNFIRSLAEQRASLDCGEGCNEERFRDASWKCRAWLEEKLFSPGGELIKSGLLKRHLVDQIKTLTERLEFECSAADSALKAEKARAAARRGGRPR